MRIETLTLGMFQANAFIVIDEATSRCAIVDAGENGRGIAERVAELGVSVEKILLTHGHLDHAGGLATVKRAFPDAPIYLHAADRPFVEGMAMQGRFFGLEIDPAPPIDHELAHGDQVEIGTGVRFTVLHCPGHTPGGVSFYEPHEGVAIVGDTLFQGSVGRTDLPGGDGATLLRSIRERLLELPDDTRIHPGHGEPSTIGRERRANPFLQAGAERLFGIG